MGNAIGAQFALGCNLFGLFEVAGGVGVLDVGRHFDRHRNRLMRIVNDVQAGSVTKNLGMQSKQSSRFEMGGLGSRIFGQGIKDQFGRQKLLVPISPEHQVSQLMRD